MDTLAVATGVETVGASLALGPLVMGLAGGLALFLYGMEKMADALKAAAGGAMRSILARLTKNRWTAAATGAFVTAVIQSSSITTVLVVGFITAGLMSFSQSIGVIFGANVGTTITAQIIAFRVDKLALLFIAVGFAMLFFSKREKFRYQGSVLMGLGLVFYGMLLMGEAMAPLRDYGPFLSAMQTLESPFILILIGTGFTALVQSSSATTGIVIVMASQGLISLPAGIALIFGSNIGTCITALLASIGKPREALRAACAHVVFNVAGVLVWIGLIPQLADLVTWLSPQAEGLTGAARMASETPRQIANAHTMFNITNTVLFLPLATLIARWIERIIPDRPLDSPADVKPKYLDVELLSTPSLALDRARMELVHMGHRVGQMIDEIPRVVLGGSRSELESLRDSDEAIDSLYGNVVTYLGKVSQAELNDDQTQEFLILLEVANDLENVGDLVETQMVQLGNARLDQDVEVSVQTRTVIERVHAQVSLAIKGALEAVTRQDEAVANQVIGMKEEINRLMEFAAVHEAGRLVAERPNRLPTYAFEVSVLQTLKRIYYFAKRIARTVVPSASLREDR